jgi:Domain of Unknown Function (DUF1259)
MTFHPIKLAAVALLVGVCGSAFAAEEGWQGRVGEALGKGGAVMPGGVYRIGLPRSDLKVTLDGVELKPGFALGGWLAFEKMGEQGMVMGDLVLTMEEVSPVMKKLAEDGIEITGAAQPPAAQPALHDVHARAGAGRSGKDGGGLACGPGRKQNADDRGGRAGRATTGDGFRHGGCRPGARG